MACSRQARRCKTGLGIRMVVLLPEDVLQFNFNSKTGRISSEMYVLECLGLESARNRSPPLRTSAVFGSGPWVDKIIRS